MEERPKKGCFRFAGSRMSLRWGELADFGLDPTVPASASTSR